MSLNKVMLIGNVGQEPVVRYLDSGVCVATFSLATTERGYTLQNGTQVPERTEWHNIVVWRKQAEFVEKYVHKGDKLYVEGKIQSRSYDDKQGVRRYVVEIMTEMVDLLTSRQTSAQQQPTAATSEPASSSVATPGVDNDYPF
ncbi:MAG: single-stranded DNA-binding protein [Bacteroidaceae bacterium]|nr:single-stranded DNA-binding protein [Bacteroidaceae bacterium]